jgi:ubiquitin thioesterase ZRANB1
MCTFENWPKALRCVICRTVRSPIHSPVLDQHITDTLSTADHQRKNSPPVISPTAVSGDPLFTIRDWETRKALGDVRNGKEYVRQVRNRMNQTDWMFLKACQGVCDNDSDPVVAYISSGGHLARQLTEDDILVLDQGSDLEVGHTLVHLALHFKREEVLSAMLTPALTDAHKRLPNHANEELAGTVRKYMASCLRQRKGDWPCYFLTESTVFSLPSEVRSLSKAAQQALLDDIVDKGVQEVLEEDSPVMNWSHDVIRNYGSRLYPLWNRTSGDCLLDSVLQATWGVFDREGALRSALYDCLSEGATL